MQIEHIEIANFRKLLSVRIDLSDEKTLFVGANNSGKTSAMLALRRFLVEKGKGFRTHDFTLCHWQAINAIGIAWEQSADGTLNDTTSKEWIPLLPAIDIWLKVKDNELHHVSALLPTLDWNGGLLGVRMRLEPNDIPAMYRDYRAAIKNVRELHAASAQNQSTQEASESLSLWPCNLTDFLNRSLQTHLVVRAYKLDPSKLVSPHNRLARPQVIAENAFALEGDPLQGLIRVNEINAQRGLGEADGAESDGATSIRRGSQKLTTQLSAYYAKHLDPSKIPDIADLAALQAIEAAQQTFDERLHFSFQGAFQEVEGMGYPGVSDPKLKIASQLSAVDGLDHEAALSFEIESTNSSLENQ